jgi:hypothetical protein
VRFKARFSESAVQVAKFPAMARKEYLVTLMLGLDPAYWLADDKAGWAASLIAAVDAAAPHLLRVETYEIRDTVVLVNMRTSEPPGRMRQLLTRDDAMIRLRTRLADLGARPEFEFERA